MKILDVKTSCLKIGEIGLFALVEVYTDEGITGFGGQNIRWGGWIDYINEVVKPILLKKIVDPFNVEKFVERYRSQPPRDVSPRPNCVEIALWDIIGKAAGQPIFRLLGSHREKVKAYLSIVPVWKPNEMAELATEYIEKGFKAIKFHRPTTDVDSDLKCIKAVRDTVGYEMEIMVDADMAWAPIQIYNFRTALKMARGLEKYEASWFEEPLSYDRRPELVAKLAAAADIPIAGGGQVFGVHRYKWLIENEILDIVQPDVQHSGGIQESHRTALLADAYGKQCIPHSGLGPVLAMVQNLQVTGSSPNIHYVEYGMKSTEMALGVRESILTEYITIDKDGYIEIPKKPGLGVELDKEEVARRTMI